MKYSILLAFFLFMHGITTAQVKYEQIVDSLTRLGQQDKVILYLEKALATHPKDEHLLNTLGYEYITRNNLDMGEKYFKQGLVVNPACSRCYANLGKTSALKKDYVKGIEYMDKAITADPKKAGNYNFRGQLREMAGQHTTALTDYDKAIGLAPDSAMYYVDRARIYGLQDKSVLAMVDLNKAVKLAPDNATIYMERANVYVERGMTKEALADVNTVIQKDSTESQSFMLRGNIYAGQKDYISALADFNRVVSLHKTDYRVYYNRALTKYFLEDMDGYCTDMHHSYELLKTSDPKNEFMTELQYHLSHYCDSSTASYYYQRGIAHYNLQQFDQAVAVYNRGLQRFPTNALLLQFRGNAFLALQNYKASLTDYAASVKNKDNIIIEAKANKDILGSQSPEDYVANFLSVMQIYITEAHFALEQYDDALTAINKGIAISPGEKTLGKDNYYHARGSVLLALGKYQQAVSDFDKCIQLNQTNAGAYINRAIAKINLSKQVRTRMQLVTGQANSPGFNVNWQLPAKVTLKTDDEQLTSAYADSNKAVELNGDLGLSYYVRGYLRKLLNIGGYCYDLAKAQQLKYPVDKALMEGCRN